MVRETSRPQASRGESRTAHGRTAQKYQSSRRSLGADPKRGRTNDRAGLYGHDPSPDADSQATLDDSYTVNNTHKRERAREPKQKKDNTAPISLPSTYREQMQRQRRGHRGQIRLYFRRHECRRARDKKSKKRNRKKDWGTLAAR